MDICFSRSEDELFIELIGELDHHSAKGIGEKIDFEILICRPKSVFLDFEKLDFMDSSGLGLIMGRFALVKKYGGELCVLDPSPAVMKIIRLAGMERMVTILKTKVK